MPPTDVVRVGGGGGGGCQVGGRVGGGGGVRVDVMMKIRGMFWLGGGSGWM